MNTIFSLIQYATDKLKDTYDEQEIRSICHLIFMDIFKYTKIDIHLRKHETLNESFVNRFYGIIAQLQTNIPIQYIIGETEFAGFRFKVTPSTLIPRPETEELVQWISGQAVPGCRVLDIGTGSGCIAISLSRLIPGAQVTAFDISGEALEIARFNNSQNNTDVNFIRKDILQREPCTGDDYDIIVSNPPYVRKTEKKEMHARVLDFEPHMALFVPDNDPLVFYRAIAGFGQTHLHPGGMLFFEINEAFGNETVQMLREYEYQDIQLKKDIYGKKRFIKCNTHR